MDSQPWKKQLVQRALQLGEENQRIKISSSQPIYRSSDATGLVPSGELEIEGVVTGEGHSAGQRFLVVLTAPTVEVEAWKEMTREQRQEARFFKLWERWVPVERGLVVGDIRAPEDQSSAVDHCIDCDRPRRECSCSTRLRCSCGTPDEVCTCAGRADPSA